MGKIHITVLVCLLVSKVIGLNLGARWFSRPQLAGLLPICLSERMRIQITDEEMMTARVLLFTGNRTFTAYPLQEMSFLLQDVDFDPQMDSLIYIHGFTQNATSTASLLLSDAFQLLDKYNVLLLDLSQLFSFNYLRSVLAVRRVGDTLGTQLHILRKMGYNLDRLIVVGHSLGAHVAGFAGKSFSRRSGAQLPAIIALDPAGPCYSAVPGRDRLDRGDAVFVQAIHTNAGTFGMTQPIAHLDFYVNGGRFQPAGPPTANTILNIFLSHERAVQLMYYGTINAENFVGVECHSLLDVDLRNCHGDRKAVFGLLADPRARGIFSIETSDRPPYLERNSITNNRRNGFNEVLLRGRKFLVNATNCLSPLNGIL